MSDGMQRQIMVILHPFVIQRRWARWHAETNYGHSAHLFTIRRQLCPMARREKLWSFCALLSSRGGEPDDMWRQIMVIPHTFLPFGDNRVWWHAKTNYGHSVPFCHPEAASPMTCGDKLWSFCTPFRHPNTIVSDGMQRQLMVILRLLSSRGGEPDDIWRQIMVILHLLPSRYDRVRWHVEKNYGHSAPFVIQRRRARWHAEIPYGHPRLSSIEKNEFDSIRMMLVVRCWSFSKFLQVPVAGRLTGRMMFRSNEISVLSLLPFYLQ